MKQEMTMKELVALVNSRDGEFRIDIEFGKEHEEDGKEQKEDNDSINQSFRAWSGVYSACKRCSDMLGASNYKARGCCRTGWKISLRNGSRSPMRH